MNELLENELLRYLGELFHESDNTCDWMKKEEVLKKIDAVNLLLGCEAKEKRLNWLEKVMIAAREIKP